jgi:uncharacterized protein YeaO (DUF488 family)
MKKALKLRTLEVGTLPKRGDGLRINTARHPQRGVRRSQLRRKGHFDSWLPLLAPSQALLARTPGKRFDEPAVRERFFASYEHEMQQSGPRHTIAFLGRLAQHTPISMGCLCEDEPRCHRSRLPVLIERAASKNLL